MATYLLGTNDIWEFSKAHPWTMGAIAVATLIVIVVAFWTLVPWNSVRNAVKNPGSASSLVLIWAILSLLCFVLANVMFVVARIVDPLSAPNAAMVFSIFWAIAVAVLILCLIFQLPPETNKVYAVLSALAGGILGWGLGMYISPEGPTEQQQFAKIGTAIVAVFSGFGLKVAIDWLSKDENKKFRIHCALLVLSAAVSTAAVYNTRAYGNNEVKITIPDGVKPDAKDKQKVTVNTPVDITFTAAVTGIADTSVTWQLISNQASSTANDAEISEGGGRFTTKTPGTYKILARSNGDPRMADVVEVTVKDEPKKTDKKEKEPASSAAAQPANATTQ